MSTTYRTLPSPAVQTQAPTIDASSWMDYFCLNPVCDNSKDYPCILLVNLLNNHDLFKQSNESHRWFYKQQHNGLKTLSLWFGEKL